LEEKATESDEPADLETGDVIFLTVPDDETGERLDTYLARELEDTASRSRIQKWIKSGNITRDGARATPAARIQAGEQYRVEPPAPARPNLEPVAMDFDVLYEDEALAVIHKPAGITVHPGPGESRQTLVNGLVHRWQELKDSGSERPGIVHRLDRMTEGLLLVARQEHALALLSRQFQERTVYKEYLAYTLVTPPTDSGEVDAPIARHPVERRKMHIHPSGRAAKTEYFTEETFITKKGRKFARVRLHPISGRTHQLRVHLAHIGCPIVGDPLYSRSRGRMSDFGLLLLARKLEFTHPANGERMRFALDLPERFQDFEAKCVHF
jgi:23S rRNA pseudouridine1911/1915/1917 synthase